MRWRRAGWALAVILPIGFVFTAVPFGFTIVALDNARPARIGHTRPIVSGSVQRATPLTTPLGADDVAIWIGRVGRTEKRGKNSYFHVYCTLAEIDGAEVDGLRLEG